MSRVDDDRDAARVAARLAEQKRADESQRTKKSAEASQFSRLVGQQKQQAQQAQDGSLAKSAIAQLLEAAEAGEAQLGEAAERGLQGQQQEGAFKSRLGQKGLEQKVQQHTRADGEQSQKAKLADDQGQTQSAQSRQADQGSAARGTEGRKTDARVGRERTEERHEAGDAAGAQASAGARGKGDKGELKAGADGGGGKQGGGGDSSKDGAPAMAAGFRFNPALMAPVSVARQKDVSGSERLRKVANELAQKIVERVRIGTNSMGRVEFQVDLRGDVLAGLSVKVSAHNGKIKAVFQGSDKDVLKMIEEQGEALKSALSARGLSLEDLKIEARA